MSILSSAIFSMSLALAGAQLVPASQESLFSSDSYAAADQLLSNMSLDEKIAQVLLVRYPEDNIDGVAELAKHQFGGYVFFGKDFQGRSTAEVQRLMQELQDVANVPILTAVDEEGGLVSRLSNNSQLVDEPFLSPQALYRQGGLEVVRADTVQKSAVLANLGLNLNLAPVVDVSINPSDYMYSRSLGQDAATTAQYAQTIIAASQGSAVSYTLKHFPGYGNNLDTHKETSLDRRSLLDLLQYDLLPFHAGIDAGAEAVLVSHNIVSSIDAEYPSSLSPKIHQLLRDTLGFTGVIITDDLAMGALGSIPHPAAQALIAGNDLIITTDYAQSIADIKAALANGTLTEDQLNRAVRQVLAWKHYKALY